MGQTDIQFKAFIRVTLETLKEIYEQTSSEKLKCVEPVSRSNAFLLCKDP